MGIAVFFALLAGFVLYSNPLRARIVDERPSALRDLPELLTALIMYEFEYKTFPATLTALGPPQHGGVEKAEAVNFIDSKLASGVHFGYVYHYFPTKSQRTGKFDAFTITADPAGLEYGDKLHYFSDETAVIRVESNHAATAVSPLVKALVGVTVRREGAGLQPVKTPDRNCFAPSSGVCGNPRSHRAGLLTFEHQGCPEFERE